MLSNDTDVDSGAVLSAVLASAAANGSLTLNADGSFSYTPAPDFNGSDSFSYRANDGAVDSGTATVSITVMPVSDPPAAVDDLFGVPEDSGATVLDVLFNDDDPDSAGLSIGSVTQPANGVTAIAGGGTGISYTPGADYCNNPPGSSPDTFSYALSPGGSTATVSVTVTCVNDPPVAFDNGLVVDEDTVANVPASGVLANDLDADGDSLTAVLDTNPSNGTLSLNANGSYTYTPDLNYNGSDSFTYRANDGVADSNIATVNITINPVNDAPVVTAPGPFSVTGNVRIQVPDGGSDLLAGASDPEGGSVSIGGTVPTATVQGGNLSINTTTGSFSYNPPAGYEGADSFIYEVCDSSAACASATVNLSVSGMVWFVNPAAGAGDGRLATPFNSIGALNAANGTAAGPAANEAIFLYSGSHSGSLALLAGQQLFGQGATPSLAALTGITLPPFSDPFPATGGARPNWTASNATALTLASNNTLRGFNIGDTGTGKGVVGASVGTLTVDQMLVSGTGQALDLSSGSMAGSGFDSVSSASSAAQGIRLDAIAGTVALGSGSIAGSTGTAFLASGTLGTVTYAGSIAKTSAGTLVSISGPGSGDVALSGNMNCTASCSAGSGANGLRVSGRSGGTITLSGANKIFRPDTASSNVQVRLLNNVGATISFSGTTAVGSNATPVQGTAYEFTGGGNINLADNMDAVTLNARILDADGVTLSGSPGIGGFRANGALGSGVPVIEITNSAAPGGVSFGQPLRLDLDDMGESGGGIRLQDNTGSYSFPNVEFMSSTDTAALRAANAGVISLGSSTTGNFTNFGGTAIDVQNTTIGAAGITMRQVRSFNATHGIILDNTGNVGAFTVTGDGPNGTDGSGGTIQNISERGISITNASNVTLRNIDLNNVATTDNDASCNGLANTSCNAGVHLNGVSAIVLDNTDLDGSGQIGINGVNVSGLTLENSDIRNCGDEVNEGCLQVFGLSGTSAISNSSIAFPSERAAYITNTNSPNLILSVINSTFSDTQSSAVGADGLELNFMGSSTATVDVVDSAFRRNRSNGLQVLAQGSSTVGVDITGSTFDRESGIGIGMDLAASDNAGLDFNVIGNPLINSRGGSAVNVFADNNAVIEGRINNNPSIQAGGAGTSGFGINVVTNENSQGTVQINNNVVSNIGSDTAIRTMARLKAGAACGTGCTAGRLDATVTNNSSTVDATSAYDIQVQANDANTICANVVNNSTSAVAIAAFRERSNAANSTVLLQGFVTDAVATWNGNGNTPINSVSPSNNGILQGGTCSTPGNPLP